MESASASIAIAKHIPAMYMKYIQRGLGSGKHHVEQAMLKLLVAVISAGGTLAKDVFATFNFNPKVAADMHELLGACQPKLFYTDAIFTM